MVITIEQQNQSSDVCLPIPPMSHKSFFTLTFFVIKKGHEVMNTLRNGDNNPHNWLNVNVLPYFRIVISCSAGMCCSSNSSSILHKWNIKIAVEDL